jgi:hypothetical protein
LKRDFKTSKLDKEAIMEPRVGAAGGPAEIPGQGSSTATDSTTQRSLPSETRPTRFEKDELIPPSWGERFVTGAKVFGLGLGVVAGAVLAVGLLPFTYIGSVLHRVGMEEASEGKILSYTDTDGANKEIADSKIKTGKSLVLAGNVLAAPMFGAMRCVIEIGKSLEETDINKPLSEIAWALGCQTPLSDEAITSFSNEIKDFKARDLQRLYNEIADLEEISLGRFMGSEKVSQDKKDKLQEIVWKKFQEKKAEL